MSAPVRHSRVGRRGVLAGAAGLIASPAVLRAQGKTSGVALVIGNSKYQWEASRPNVKRDASDIAKGLQSLGLRTELVQDASREAMKQAVDKFKSAARGADFATFYYAGHGVTWDQDTFLVPVDSDLTNPNVVPTLLPVPSVNAAMKEASNRLLVFDNCRNNPSDGWRQLAAQRTASINPDKQRAAAVDQDSNTLTLFSTAPGRVALDGPAGQNSPFAAALLRQLGGRSIDLQALPAKMRRELLIASEGRQVVWDQNTYRQSFVLSGSGKPAASAGGAAGWSGDPSRIVEIRNAYAYARENKLLLPEGLIAHRPAGNSIHAKKIGAFKFTIKTPVGPSPGLLVVVSADEQGTAELILTVSAGAGVFWRFITGKVSGDRLEYEPYYERPKFILDWRDANSGSVAQMSTQEIRSNGMSTMPFTRLD